MSGVLAEVNETGTDALRSSSFVSQAWFRGLGLVLLVILTYSPVWQAGFAWDDDLLLTSNPVIAGPLGLKEIWTTKAADICPLTLTLFWGIHALWGFAPVPYHLINIFLHAASAVLLWRVLTNLNVRGAWMGTALWALHPVAVESVASVCEMKNTLSGFFFLLSILFFLRWLKTKANQSYAITLICAALAMASKTSTVILPIVFCLCIWWMEGRWQWRNLMHVALFFLIAIASSALAVWNQDLQLATPPFQPVRSWPERLATAGDVTWFYLGKLIWPHPLMLMYPHWEIHAEDWLSYIPVLGTIIILLILWFYRHSWSRPYFFALAYFVVCLFPVMGLMDQVWFWYSFVSDHFQYLASMGPLALVGIGIIELTKPLATKRIWLRPSVCIGALLILSVLSWQRAWAFKDRDTLWKDTWTKNPSFWPAYNHVGVDLLNQGKLTEAIPLFEKALAINPGSAQAHNNLGMALAQTEGMDPAIEQFRKAIEINPEFTEAHDNLGLALLHKGQTDDAIAQYRLALQIDPDNAGAHVNLGNALLTKGQVDGAIAQFQEALRLKPGYDPAQSSLIDAQAIARQRQGQSR